MEGDAPLGVARHAIRASHNAYELGHDRMTVYMEGRAGGIPESDTDPPPPALLQYTIGGDRANAFLSGISDGARRRYETSRRHRSSSFEQHG